MQRSRELRWMVAVTLIATTWTATARAAEPSPPTPVVMAETLPPLPAPELRRWQTGLLRPDRLRHASLSLAIGLGAGLMSREPAAAAGGLVVGLAKELWDVRRGRGFDGWDLLADALGSAAGAGATAALQDQD